MLRHEAFVKTDVSGERNASIIKVTRICEPGTLAVSSNRSQRTGNVPGSPILVTLMMEALRSPRNVGYYKNHMA
jgi:hypothetical protein